MERTGQQGLMPCRRLAMNISEASQFGEEVIQRLLGLLNTYITLIQTCFFPFFSLLGYFCWCCCCVCFSLRIRAGSDEAITKLPHGPCSLCLLDHVFLLFWSGHCDVVLFFSPLIGVKEGQLCGPKGLCQKLFHIFYLGKR